MKFQFECITCGKCCKHYKVIINVVDALKLFHYTNCKFKETFYLYSKEYVKDSYNIYKLFKIKNKEYYLGMFEQDGCIFLKDNKCSVHKYKPHVCYFYPINYVNGKFKLEKYDICNAKYDGKFTEWNDLEHKYEVYNRNIYWHNEMVDFWNEHYSKTGDFKDFIIFFYESLYPIYLKELIHE